MSNKELIDVKVFSSDKFKVFIQEYEGSHYPDQSLQVLFLKGYCNLPIHMIARVLQVRYTEALRLTKELEKEIHNIRSDRKLEIIRKEKVTGDHLLKYKAGQLRDVLDELEKRSLKQNRFDNMNDKQLFELAERLEKGIVADSEYYTGNIDEGSFPMEKLIFNS